MTGEAYVELRLRGVRSLSVLTDGWTEKEMQALFAGEKKAKEKLAASLEQQIWDKPDECELVAFEVHIEARSSEIEGERNG